MKSASSAKIPARFILADLPRAAQDTPRSILTRLETSARLRRKRRLGPGPEIGADLTPETEEWNRRYEADLARSEARAREWATAYHQRSERARAGLAHLKPDEREALRAAYRSGQASGVMGRDEVEERIAELHAAYPWLAPASNAVMQHMRLRTAKGRAPAHTPPLILLGPPGIAKSSWARDLGRIFGLHTLSIDIGASQGATFAIAGTEKGWGTAAPGRVVSAMLAQRLANPLVILDEIDKIPEQVGTSSGRSLPGAFEALKSMIEPSTAKGWTCPYYQIPFDLTGVSWVMTTNSIDQMPDAFLDRCKLIRLQHLSPKQLRDAGQKLIASRLAGEAAALASELLEAEFSRLEMRGFKPSLRVAERRIEAIEEMLQRPLLI